MSRRIEIELTSQRSETEWTWRAAGAKQPKGVLAADVLYVGAKVGDVVKAEADFEIEGIFVTSVAPPVAKRQDKTQRVEIVGSSQKFEPVTSQLSGKSEKRGKGKRDDFFNFDGASGNKTHTGLSGTGPARPRGDRPERSRSDRPGGSRGDRPGGDRTRTDRPGGDRATSTGGDKAQRTGRPERSSRPARPERPAAPTYKRLAPKDVHRSAVLDQVPAEQRPIAEQVLRGGMPAVRQAIEAENTKAKAEGRPEVNSAALTSLAEELLPQLKAAEWMDKAEAAKAQASEISVRDIRAVVSGADAVARTDEARVLASELREVLDRRTTEERDNWVKEIETAIGEGKSIRALRLSARPPDPQAKFPPELLDRLKTAAENSMSPDTPADRWITVLDAVANSPVRRTVEPKGLPETPGEALLSAAKQAAGRIPALAKLLGVSMPPPPRRLPPKPVSAARGSAPRPGLTPPSGGSSVAISEEPNDQTAPTSSGSDAEGDTGPDIE